MEGTWKAGEKLPSEHKLCDQLGVSRVSVRSALQSLEAQGFIETRRGEGSFVKPFSLTDQWERFMPLLALDGADVMAVLEFRLIIEPGIIAPVMEKINREDLDGLEALYRRMEESSGNIGEFARLDERFHLRLIEIMGNPIMERVYRVLLEVLNSAWQEICEVLGTRDGLTYHRAIIDAFRDKDQEKGRKLMAEHVERTISRMGRYYES